MLELAPLGTLTLQLRKPIRLKDTPVGARWIFEVESGQLEGDRVRGTIKGHANADWLIVGADGTGTVDVRGLLETDDGALVFIQYHGRLDMNEAGAPVYSTAG
jgi:hypothetical protein